MISLVPRRFDAQAMMVPQVISTRQICYLISLALSLLHTRMTLEYWRMAEDALKLWFFKLRKVINEEKSTAVLFTRRLATVIWASAGCRFSGLVRLSVLTFCSTWSLPSACREKTFNMLSALFPLLAWGSFHSQSNKLLLYKICLVFSHAASARWYCHLGIDINQYQGKVLFCTTCMYKTRPWEWPQAHQDTSGMTISIGNYVCWPSMNSIVLLYSMSWALSSSTHPLPVSSTRLCRHCNTSLLTYSPTGGQKMLWRRLRTVCRATLVVNIELF